MFPAMDCCIAVSQAIEPAYWTLGSSVCHMLATTSDVLFHVISYCFLRTGDLFAGWLCVWCMPVHAEPNIA